MRSFPLDIIGALVFDGTATTGASRPDCTATKVAERQLLTAAHCVFDAGEGEASLKLRDWWPGADGFDFTMSGGSAAPNGAKNIQWYVYDPKFVEDGWTSRDYAVLVLYDNANTCTFGGLGYKVDGSLAGRDYLLFGYPGANRTCPTASPVSADACGGSMWGMEAEIDSTSASFVFIDHDTQPGQSGSAIYEITNGNRQIVANHRGAWSGTSNVGVKMRNRVFDMIEGSRDEHDSAFCSF